MNVFLLHEDPREAARGLVDKHVVKMTTEGVQILNTALHASGASDLAFYKPTHSNHPWCEWASESYEQWRLVADYTDAIGWEFIERYGKPHTSHEKMAQFDVKDISTELGRSGPACPSDTPQTMLDEYKQNNTIEAYRDYYRNEKLTADWAKYEYTDKPSWL